MRFAAIVHAASFAISCNNQRANTSNAAFVGNTGAAEDRAVVAAIQKGMASNANTHFTFGRYESLIIHFHKQLRAALTT